MYEGNPALSNSAMKKTKPNNNKQIILVTRKSHVDHQRNKVGVEAIYSGHRRNHFKSSAKFVSLEQRHNIDTIKRATIKIVCLSKISFGQ